MSHSELLAFLRRGRVDSGFRQQLSNLNSPEEILDFVESSGFSFSSEVRGRFLNRWKGVYFCPQAIEVGCLLYTSPSPRDYAASRMPSSA